MKKDLAALRRLSLFALIFSAFLVGCTTAGPRSDSNKLSDAYFIEVRDHEDPTVMQCFFEVNDALKANDYTAAVDAATKGIDAIPKYPELFSYFYAMRGYSNIMLYNLEKGQEDIKNLETYDKRSSMIPGLWTYYYFSYAPFDPNPKEYYLKAKQWLAAWQAARPRNTFELVFSDPARIADMGKIIDDELKK